jgi:hypothetical protein
LPAAVVEQGLQELGEALGAASSRPERETGRGPDVMWAFADVTLCIEAKNEKVAPISKSDAGQLVLSQRWCEQSTTGSKADVIPLFATNVDSADRPEDIAFCPALLTEDYVFKLLASLKQLVMGLSFDGPLFGNPADVTRALSTRGLGGKQIASALPHMKP